MAMTRKEKDYLARVERERDEALAWRRTRPVTPDITPADAPWDRKAALCGYIVTVAVPFNSRRVLPAQTTSNMHYIGKHENPGVSTWSQRGIPMYSTRLGALRQLRYCIEETTARELAQVDAEIRAEELELQARVSAAMERDHEIE